MFHGAADGKPNLNAPSPRLADGKPDFSGIWQVAEKIPCTKEVFKFVDCGLEIGGSLLALNIAMYRQVFIDGRPLPVDPNPAWTGYSSARWEGDALVVQTIGFRDGRSHSHKDH